MINQSRQEVKNSGVFVGIIKDNADPERLGRLKVLVPGYNDNTALDDLQWFNYVSPFGGYSDQGFFFIPPVGAEVVVMFPNGGETPIWFGCINKKKDNPGPRESTQEADDDHYTHRKQLKTRIGWIMFDDKEEYISINHNTGSFIALDKDGNITIRAEKNINLKAGKNVSISSENGSVSLESSDALKIEAHKGDLTVSADKGKMAICTLSDKLNIVSDENIEIVSKKDIKSYADQDLYMTTAKGAMYQRAKKNIEVYTDEALKTHCEKDMLLGAKNDLTISASNDIYQSAEKNYYSTAGGIGKLSYGKSTDIALGSGEFDISSVKGELKLITDKDIIISSTKGKTSIYGKDGVSIKSDKDLDLSSSKDIEMFSQKNTNISVLNNMNINSKNDFCASASRGVYLSATDVLDISADSRLYFHTKLNFIQEAGVLFHTISKATKHDQLKSFISNSSEFTNVVKGSFNNKAAIINLN